MSEINIKQAIKQEYIRCANDPVHFMKKYCMIQHPQKGRMNFNLYSFQEKLLEEFKANDYNIILKSRQLGISTLSAGFALWQMLFNEDKNILCIATKQETAKNMVTKVKTMYDNLPSWLTVPYDEKNKLTLRLKNGSQIKATSAASDAGRSEAVSLLIIDEAAFIDNIDTIWASAQQTLATGGGCIALSTPFGTGNWFHKEWQKAETGDGLFNPIRLKWDVHPERDQNWRNEQDTLLGPKMAAQECDCDFTTSGDVVFDKTDRDYISENFIQEPIEKRGLDKKYWIFAYPDYQKDYMVLADVARGDGFDYSTFHVIDIETNEQVAEYKGQMGTTEFGKFLVSVATEWNNALLIVENASVGWNVLSTIEELEYRNLYRTPKGKNSNEFFDPYNPHNPNLVPGFTMSVSTRPMVINKVIEYVRDRSLIIRSKRTLEEMEVFEWRHGKAQAQYGYNDDLIMPLGMGMYLRDTALRYREANKHWSKTSLENTQVVRNSRTTPGGYGINPNQNLKNVRTAYGNQDFTWLLK